MAKDIQDNDDKKRHEKGGVRRISRPQEKRLTQQLTLNPLPINRDHLDSEADRFQPGDAERLRKLVM